MMGQDRDCFVLTRAGVKVTLTSIYAEGVTQEKHPPMPTAAAQPSPLRNKTAIIPHHQFAHISGFSAAHGKHLLRAEIDPDSDDITALGNGTDGTYDRIEYTGMTAWPAG